MARIASQRSTRKLLHWSYVLDAGVVDENIDGSEMLLCVMNESGALFRISKVCRVIKDLGRVLQFEAMDE